MSLPHVLVVPSWYPTEEMPVNGVFFRDQTHAYKALGAHVGVIFPEHRSIRQMSPRTLSQSHFQRLEQDDQGVPTLRRRGWKLFKSTTTAGRFWVKEAQRQFALYVQKHGKPDLLHAHSVMWGGIAAAAISAETGIPFVITEHSSAFARKLLPPEQIEMAKSAFKSASRVLAVGSELGKLLTSDGVVAADKLRVVPNMVDTEFFTLPPTPRGQVPFRFLSVSLLLPNKGFDTLLEAFAQAFRGNSGLLLEIGGNGVERPKLEALVEKLGISAQVTFLGMLDRKGVRDALWRANALAHASHYETFGVILIEALATGLPIVATRCGGPQDIVCDFCGKLVAVKDSGALAAAMQQILTEQYEPSRLREFCQGRFSRDVVARTLADVYSEVLS